jgi:hypothetical protein
MTSSASCAFLARNRQHPQTDRGHRHRCLPTVFRNGERYRQLFAPMRQDFGRRGPIWKPEDELTERGLGVPGHIADGEGLFHISTPAPGSRRRGGSTTRRPWRRSSPISTRNMRRRHLPAAVIRWDEFLTDTDSVHHGPPFKSTPHEVMVVPGGFSWEEKTYPSLSTIAHDIALMRSEVQ